LEVPVYLPRDHLVTNTLVLGAAGTGKTTYLLHLVAEVLADPGWGVFVLDPHGSLAPRVLGLLPPGRAQEAFCVRLGDKEHPVALNLLDTKGGRSAEEIENGLIGGFAYHWDGAWGARAWSRSSAARCAPCWRPISSALRMSSTPYST
jgi:hypothetical protein